MSDFAKHIKEKHKQAMKQREHDKELKERTDYKSLLSSVKEEIEKNSNNKYIHFTLPVKYGINARRKVLDDIIIEFKDIAMIYEANIKDPCITIKKVPDWSNIPREIKEEPDIIFLIDFSRKLDFKQVKWLNIMSHKYLISGRNNI